MCAGAPEIVEKSRILRNNLALAQAISGDRQQAIDSFQRLWHDQPRFPAAALNLAELLLDSRQADRAIEIAAQVNPQLSNDVIVPLLEARAYRRLGRIDEAWKACERAMALDSMNGSVNAVAAAIHLDLGHFEEAALRIASAEALAPGECYVRVVRAEITLKTLSVAEAETDVEAAIRATRDNPFVFLDAEIERLKAALQQRLAARLKA